MKITKLNYNIDWSNIFYYDETSPSSLRHVNDNGYKGTAGVFAGDIAGSLRKSKRVFRWYVRYNKETYSVHRIIYVIKHGFVPDDMVINHIDCDPTNNNINNLELCTNTENCRRQKKHLGLELQPNNVSGYNGIHVHYSNGKPFARVQWVDHTGIRRNKAFSFSKYGGEIGAFEAASNFRNQMIKIANENGAGYAIKEKQ